MFNPTKEQVRHFFIETWRKQRIKTEILTPLEMIAAEIIIQHPEYHSILDDPASVDRNFTPDDGQINPFLHLSLHLAIEEQLSIDQPPGIRSAFKAILSQRNDYHAAAHTVLECLGETIFEAQHKQSKPDEFLYLECIRRRTLRH